MIEKDEAPFKANAGQDPDAEAGLPEGRHGHRRDFVVDHRRRRGAGADARIDGRQARAASRSPRIVGHATHAQEPHWFTTAPVGAIAKLYEKTGWTTGSVDLFEINEAFAVVAMAAMKEHGIPHDKINIHGGAWRWAIRSAPPARA